MSKKFQLVSLSLIIAGFGLCANINSISAKASAKSESTAVSHVGGAAMFSNKNIIENASNSPIHKTLVAAVKAAGLVETLEGVGPFTVFAPTDAAFNALPAGTVDTLLKPENKAKLAGILTYHVVSGNVRAADLTKMIKDGGGKATIKTVQGESLTAALKGKKVELTDTKGNVAEVTQADVQQSNGVIHVINKVLMP
ncbi:MAG: fasciclin domain-containing protein [Candidatus Obscuribacterales bacterium]|nr:fasciclin domain-containing protein [Candidatus Obscuribacterales bacterium]